MYRYWNGTYVYDPYSFLDFKSGINNKYNLIYIT